MAMGSRSIQMSGVRMAQARQFGWILLAAWLSLLTARTVLGGDQAAEAGLRLSVSRSIPVVGEKQMLTALVRHAREPRTDASVVFMSIRDDNGGAERVMAEKPVMLTRDAETLVVETEWTPLATGDHKLVARLQAPGANGTEVLAEATQSVVATRRLLHFHYWSPVPELDYVTGGLVTQSRIDGWKPHGNLLEYWADRGVIAQRWGGALWEWNHSGKGKETQERIKEVARSWNRAYPRWPGIVIDELGASPENEVNQFLGAAITAAKENQPEQYIAVYIIGFAGGERYLKGIEAADLILSESYLSRPYTRDGAWDYPRHRRYQAPLEAGFGSKTLLTLSLGRFDGITTPQELRRQLHWTRYTYPDMPGISFFEGAQHLVPYLNRELRGFYINPVLRVKAGEDGIVAVSNIGGAEAPATRIRVAVGEAGSRAVDVDVPPLDVDGAYTFALAIDGEARRVVTAGALDGERPGVFEKRLRPASEFGPDVYVLGPPLLWNEEPAASRPGAADAWPVPGEAALVERELTAHEPSLGMAADGQKTPPLYHDIENTLGRSFLLSFTLHAEKVGQDRIQLRLDETNGESWFELDVSTFSQFSFSNQSRDRKRNVVQEYLPLEMEDGACYRYRVLYDASGSVRVAIHDAAGEKLWDSGMTPVIGPMRFDHISFRAEKGVQWDAAGQTILLRGKDSRGRLADFELDVYERQNDTRRKGTTAR